MKINAEHHIVATGENTSSVPRRALTGRDAIAAIESWTDLTAARRRQLSAYVERGAEICAVPVDAMILTCAWLNQHVYAQRPMAHGLTRQSFGNVTTALRYVLERLGEHAPRDRDHRHLAPEWRALLDRLPDRHMRAGLVEFCRFCTGAAIPPDAIPLNAFESFEAWANEHLLHRGIRALALGAKRSWARARQHVPGWPPVELQLPSKRGLLSLPLSALPASFADDLARFEAEMAGDFRRSGDRASKTQTENNRGRKRRKPARLATIESRRQQILAAASALVRSGIPPARIRKLRDLVEPIDHADVIFEAFWRKAGNQPNSQTGGIAAAIKRVACVHCNPSPPEAGTIAEWAREMTPEPSRGLTRKNRERLAAMIQPRTLNMLLNLPRELAERAADPATARKTAVALMQVAVAVEILLRCPLRLENLCEITIGGDLRRLDPGSPRFSHLSIAEERVKNGIPIEWTVRPEISRRIEDWLAHFAPRSRPNENYYLFPGRHKGGISTGGMHRAIKTTISDVIGIDVNPHLFRHFAVWLHLKNHPGDYETARRLLGHSTVATTVRFYSGLETEAAAQRHDALVEEARRRGQSAARQEFKRSRPRRRTRKEKPDA